MKIAKGPRWISIGRIEFWIANGILEFSRDKTTCGCRILSLYCFGITLLSKDCSGDR